MSNDDHEPLSEIWRNEGETEQDASDRAKVAYGYANEARRIAGVPLGKRIHDDLTKELETAREIESAIKKLLGLNICFWNREEEYFRNYVESSTGIVSIEYELWRWVKLLIERLEECKGEG